MALHKTDEQLEQVARTYLQRIGLEYQVRPDLMTMLVKTKHIDTQFNYARVPDEKLPAAEAEWDSAKICVRMRESVFVGMQRNEPRARMTVAHEIAHYVLGHKGVLNRKPGIRMSDIPIASIRREESEAKRTGAIILAPEYLIPVETSPEEIAAMFGLSTEAALYRYEEIARIRRRREGVQRPLPQSIVDYLREAKRRGYHVRTDVDE